MLHLLSFCFGLLALIVIGYVLKQAISGKTPLLSIRNVFLAGVIIFQLTSAATSYYFGSFGELPIGDPAGSGIRFLFIISAFLILFALVYERRWFTFRIQDRIRVRTPIPGTGALLTMSFACLIAGAIFKLGLSKLGLFGILSEIFGLALVSMAAGSAAWAWASRPKNLLLLSLMLLIAGAAAAVAMYEAFGRRGVVSVMVACLWGAYHGGFKHFDFKRAAIPLLVVGMSGVLLVAAFTSTRGNKGKGVGVGEAVMRLANADIGDGLLQLLAGQDAAGCSLWVIENRPEPFPYEPLGSLVYLAVNPIPRVIWDDKPIGLGSEMVKQSNVQGKGEEYSVGPGLVGHIVNDNPWISLPLYALLLGAWLRILDDVLKRFPDHPYVVIPLGIELGEILGIARGEMGFFLFRAIMGMVVAYFGTIVMARLLRAVGFAYRPAEPEAELEPMPDYADTYAAGVDE